MIDSTIVRAHQHSAGAKKGVAPKPLVVRREGWARRFTVSAMPWGTRRGFS